MRGIGDFCRMHSGQHQHEYQYRQRLTDRARDLNVNALKLSILALFLGVGLSLKAQDQPFVHHTERGKQDSLVAIEAKDLQTFLRNGRFFGHARFFSMLTDNSEGLTDYQANAVGVGIGYETGKWKGFQLGISGYAIYHLASSNLSDIDPLSNQPNRYELGLFDVEDPMNKNELDRLEDLYLKYSSRGLLVKLGKQHIRSPFINPQDGRMRPTLVEGLLLDYQLKSKMVVNAGLVNQISPRSTVHWYGVGESMGLYGVGVNPDGSKSNYKGNMPSSVVAFIGMDRDWKQGKLKLWEQVVTEVFETRLLQWDGRIAFNSALQAIDKPQKEQGAGGGLPNVHASQVGSFNAFIYGLQWIGQRSLANGGNVDPQKTYFAKGARSNVFGVRVGAQWKGGWKFLLNYTRITAEGRYLMPREWGRDPFYTFMPRERNEGYGDVHAANLVLSKKFSSVRGLAVDLSYGRFYLPDVKNYALNKYGFPAYQQANVDVRYAFGGFWKGLDLQFLVVMKDAINTTYDLPKYEINKVNLSHLNLILNYHF